MQNPSFEVRGPENSENAKCPTPRAGSAIGPSARCTRREPFGFQAEERVASWDQDASRIGEYDKLPGATATFVSKTLSTWVATKESI